MSECTVQILSGWVVKLVIRHEILRMRIFRIPSRDHLHGGGLHGRIRRKFLTFVMKAHDDEDAALLGVVCSTARRHIQKKINPVKIPFPTCR